MQPRYRIWFLTFAVLALSACSGTRFAYQQAETLTDTAKVVAEQYIATAREANRLQDTGSLTDSQLERIQGIDARVYPVIQQLRSASDAYEAIGTAETREALEAALTDAVTAVSDFIDAVREQS